MFLIFFGIMELTLYRTQYDINEEKNICDVFPA